LYESILSGDLNGDDAEVADPENLFDETTRAENSYHVVTGSLTDNSVVLDGFTITGGNANVSMISLPDCQEINNNDSNFPSNDGANILYSPSLSRGGGMYIESGSPKLMNCCFKNNSALSCGGGLQSRINSFPTLINCTFIENTSGWAGGGMDNYLGSPILIDCKFISNTAYQYGGGIYDVSSSSVLTNCIFTNNRASYNGAGIYNRRSKQLLINSIFTCNSTNWNGSSIYMNDNSNIILINCTFKGNYGNNGDTLSCHPSLYSGTAWLSNCIMWNSGNEIYNKDYLMRIDPIILVTYSNVRGGWEGQGNIDIDPLFADPNNGDFHLKSQAGRWDPASGSWPCTTLGTGWMIDNVTSPCIDAGDPNGPIGDEPQPNGGIINMGAYGGTSQASKSYFAESQCDTNESQSVNVSYSTDTNNTNIIDNPGSSLYDLYQQYNSAKEIVSNINSPETRIKDLTELIGAFLAGIVQDEENFSSKRALAVTQLGSLGAIEVKDFLKNLAEELEWTDATRQLKRTATLAYWKIKVIEETSEEAQEELLIDLLWGNNHPSPHADVVSSWAADELANRVVERALIEITESIRYSNPTARGEEHIQLCNTKIELLNSDTSRQKALQQALFMEDFTQDQLLKHWAITELSKIKTQESLCALICFALELQNKYYDENGRFVMGKNDRLGVYSVIFYRDIIEILKRNDITDSEINSTGLDPEKFFITPP
jgi:hypothetical protein